MKILIVEKFDGYKPSNSADFHVAIMNAEDKLKNHWKEHSPNIKVIITNRMEFKFKKSRLKKRENVIFLANLSEKCIDFKKVGILFLINFFELFFINNPNFRATIIEQWEPIRVTRVLYSLPVIDPVKFFIDVYSAYLLGSFVKNSFVQFFDRINHLVKFGHMISTRV